MTESWRAGSVVQERGEQTTRLRTSAPEGLRVYLHALGVRTEIDDQGLVALDLPQGYAISLRDLLYSWGLTNDVEVVVGHAAPVTRPATIISLAPATPRLGDMLLRKGLITGDQLEHALAESRSTGERLGEVLLKRQWLFEDELARTLAGQLDIPYVDVLATGVDRGLARTIPIEIGMKYAVIPVGVQQGLVRVAFADPTDEEAQQAVRAYIPTSCAVVANLSDIRSAWRRIEALLRG